MKTSSLLFCFLLIFIAACNQPKNPKKQIQEDYYRNGIIKSRIEIRDGKRNGLTEEFNEVGQIRTSIEFKDDKKDGWYYKYSEKNNKIMIKAHFKDDMQDGQVLQYYQEGMLFRESYYTNNSLNGSMKTYWANGNLKSENYFKMDTFCTGLKEYDSKGNQLVLPSIVVKEVDQLALLDKVVLQVSLSDKSQNVIFYQDELKDGKYLDPNSYKVPVHNGIGVIEFQLSRGKTLMQKVSIVAKVRTKYDNTLILQKSYKLAITNIN
jgi:antitoxin component YwqK of YwqJK toxin-antitoxin module